MMTARVEELQRQASKTESYVLRVHGTDGVGGRFGGKRERERSGVSDRATKGGASLPAVKSQQQNLQEKSRCFGKQWAA